jgi:uncharacterized protein (TIGR02996 family)
MTHDDAFLADIIANPDDDTPRLVYADYLEDRGEPERAAFIRVQIDLARLPEADPRRQELQAGEQGLLRTHGKAWAAALLAPLAGMETHCAFRRGFIEELTVEARGLLLHADTLFRKAPLRSLEVYLARGRIGALASLPHLSRLTALCLPNNSLGDDGTRALASSPHLGGLSSLGLRGNEIGDPGTQVLAACPSLAGLRHLDLSLNRVGDAGALALARHLPRLESLELNWNRIGAAARRTLGETFGGRVKFEEAGARRRLGLPDPG